MGAYSNKGRRAASGEPRCFYVSMPASGVLVVRAYGDQKWLEIRGQYDTDPDDPLQKAIDAMPSGHASGLFSEQEIAVSPDHVAYDYFLHVWKVA